MPMYLAGVLRAPSSTASSPLWPWVTMTMKEPGPTLTLSNEPLKSETMSSDASGKRAAAAYSGGRL